MARGRAKSRGLGRSKVGPLFSLVVEWVGAGNGCDKGEARGEQREAVRRARRPGTLSIYVLFPQFFSPP